MLPTFCKSCESGSVSEIVEKSFVHTPHLAEATVSSSADLEVTVSLLIQIDKLVQLLESPVFTCKFHRTAR